MTSLISRIGLGQSSSQGRDDGGQAYQNDGYAVAGQEWDQWGGEEVVGEAVYQVRGQGRGGRLGRGFVSLGNMATERTSANSSPSTNPLLSLAPAPPQTGSLLDRIRNDSAPPLPPPSLMDRLQARPSPPIRVATPPSPVPRVSQRSLVDRLDPSDLPQRVQTLPPTPLVELEAPKTLATRLGIPDKTASKNAALKLRLAAHQPPESIPQASGSSTPSTATLQVRNVTPPPQQGGGHALGMHILATPGMEMMDPMEGEREERERGKGSEESSMGRNEEGRGNLNSRPNPRLVPTPYDSSEYSQSDATHQGKERSTTPIPRERSRNDEQPRRASHYRPTRSRISTSRSTLARSPSKERRRSRSRSPGRSRRGDSRERRRDDRYPEEDYGRRRRSPSFDHERERRRRYDERDEDRPRKESRTERSDDGHRERRVGRDVGGSYDRELVRERRGRGTRETEGEEGERWRRGYSTEGRGREDQEDWRMGERRVRELSASHYTGNKAAETDRSGRDDIHDTGRSRSYVRGDTSQRDRRYRDVDEDGDEMMRDEERRSASVSYQGSHNPKHTESSAPFGGSDYQPSITTPPVPFAQPTATATQIALRQANDMARAIKANDMTRLARLKMMDEGVYGRAPVDVVAAPMAAARPSAQVAPPQGNAIMQERPQIQAVPSQGNMIRMEPPHFQVTRRVSTSSGDRMDMRDAQLGSNKRPYSVERSVELEDADAGRKKMRVEPEKENQNQHPAAIVLPPIPNPQPAQAVYRGSGYASDGSLGLEPAIALLIPPGYFNVRTGGWTAGTPDPLGNGTGIHPVSRVVFHGQVPWQALPPAQSSLSKQRIKIWTNLWENASEVMRQASKQALEVAILHHQTARSMLTQAQMAQNAASGSTSNGQSAVQPTNAQQYHIQPFPGQPDAPTIETRTLTPAELEEAAKKEKARESLLARKKARIMMDIKPDVGGAPSDAVGNSQATGGRSARVEGDESSGGATGMGNGAAPPSAPGSDRDDSGIGNDQNGGQDRMDRDDDEQPSGSYKPYATIKPGRGAMGHLQHPYRQFHPETRLPLPSLGQWKADSLVMNRHEDFITEYVGVVSDWACSFTSNMPGFIDEDAPNQRKLVVQDLNGAVVLREAYSGPGVFRKVYKRPFLETYLEYLFKPVDHLEPDSETEAIRPYDLFVYSSARGGNVQDMIMHGFEAYEQPTDDHGGVLGFWSRENMGLSAEEYNQKSATLKDMRDVQRIFASIGTPDDTRAALRPEPEFYPNLWNIVLIDDSTEKARLNPFSHVHIPEYDMSAKARSQEQARGAILQERKLDYRTFDNSKDDLVAAIEERIAALQFGFGESMDFVHGEAKWVPSGDIILIGVIGILEELKDVLSVPAWIASGGLTSPCVESTQDALKDGWEEMVRKDLGLMSREELDQLTTEELNAASSWARATPAATSTYTISQHSAPSILPNDPGYIHWFESKPHLLYWVRRGLMALDERKLDVRHGLPIERPYKGEKRNPKPPNPPQHQDPKGPSKHPNSRPAHEQSRDWRSPPPHMSGRLASGSGQPEGSHGGRSHRSEPGTGTTAAKGRPVPARDSTGGEAHERAAGVVGSTGHAAPTPRPRTDEPRAQARPQTETQPAAPMTKKAKKAANKARIAEEVEKARLALLRGTSVQSESASDAVSASTRQPPPAQGSERPPVGQAAARATRGGPMGASSYAPPVPSGSALYVAPNSYRVGQAGSYGYGQAQHDYQLQQTYQPQQSYQPGTWDNSANMRSWGSAWKNQGNQQGGS